MSSRPTKLSEILAEDEPYYNFEGETPKDMIAPEHPKSQKIDIMSFSAIEWDFRHQRVQHILSRLARKGHRIFRLHPSLRPEKQDFTIKKLIDNIFELRPSTPYSCSIYDAVLDNEKLDPLLKSLSSAVKMLNINAISWVVFPAWTPLVLKLRKEYGWKVMYDCLDAHAEFSNVNAIRAEEERLLIKESDLVTASSQYLYKQAQNIRDDGIVYLPNACEFHHFSKLPPNDLVRVKKPIMGYIGAINDWFDTDLVEFLVTRKSNWNFVFIGEVNDSAAERLRRYANVHFLGEMIYHDLPQFIHHFDVCLIPFKDIPLIRATNPVKFYEYLASGKPIVSTKIPELEQYNQLCYIAENKEDFLKQTELALMEKDRQLLRDSRINFAKQNTWRHRVDTLYPYLESLSRSMILRSMANQENHKP